MANKENKESSWILIVEYDIIDGIDKIAYEGYTETEVDELTRKLKEELNSSSGIKFIEIEGDLFKVENIVAIRQEEE